MGTLKTFFIVLLLSGCGVKADRLVKTASNPPQLNQQIVGVVELTDQSTIDLASITDKPLILVFAQDTCLVCLEEAEGFKKAFQDPTQEPSNVKLISVIAGADLQLAQEWKQDHQIPWAVGFDYDLKIFSKYCPEKQTPCTLVQLPGSGVVFQKTGLAHAEELQAITGEWK